jgi:hypothetical protein
MNGKTLLGGIVAGIAMMVANFVMHGVIMADTYRRYANVFTQEESGPAWFALVSVLIGLALAILFARTRRVWAAGLVGGVTFGILVGATHFFMNFYDALVYEGFPYYLAWCHGGMDLIAYALGGALLGVVIKGD